MGFPILVRWYLCIEQPIDFHFSFYSSYLMIYWYSLLRSKTNNLSYIKGVVVNNKMKSVWCLEKEHGYWPQFIFNNYLAVSLTLRLPSIVYSLYRLVINVLKVQTGTFHIQNGNVWRVLPGPCYYHGLTLFLPWISNYMLNKAWYELPSRWQHSTTPPLKFGNVISFHP